MDQDFSAYFRAYLIEATTWLPPEQRKGARWVMSSEWFTEIIRLVDAAGRPLLHVPFAVGDDLYVFGYPIDVREGGGPPTLEPKGT